MPEAAIEWLPSLTMLLLRIDRATASE